MQLLGLLVVLRCALEVRSDPKSHAERERGHHEDYSYMENGKLAQLAFGDDASW